MKKPDARRPVEDLIERIERSGELPDQVSVGDIVERIGDDALSAVMLLAALVMISPASGIPGLSTVGATIIALAAVQIVLGRRKLWLPAFLAKRTIARSSFERGMSWLARPASWIDRIAAERLPALARRPFAIVPATLCIAIASVVPFLEFVPFSASIAATAVAFFALGLFARDGLLVALGLAVTGGAAWFAWSMLE